MGSRHHKQRERRGLETCAHRPQVIVDTVKPQHTALANSNNFWLRRFLWLHEDPAHRCEVWKLTRYYDNQDDDSKSD